MPKCRDADYASGASARVDAGARATVERRRCATGVGGYWHHFFISLTACSSRRHRLKARVFISRIADDRRLRSAVAWLHHGK